MNYQKKRWNKFFQQDIYETFEDYFRNYEHNGIRISAKPDPSQITALQRQKLYGVQERAPLYVTFTLENVTNNHSEAAVVEYPAVKLMDIPLYAEDGFKAKTSTIKPVSRLEYASGWYIDDADRKSYNTRLIYHSKHSRVFYFTDTGLVMSANGSKHIPVLTFLKAVTGYSFDELQLFYKDIPGFINYFFSTKELSYEECCAEALSMLRENRSYSLGTVATDLNNLLFEYIPGRAGDEKIPRYLDMESFHRCHGMRIKSISGTDSIKIGTVITSEIAEKMDKEYRITECTLTDENDRVYVIKRCYAEGFTRNLTPKEILYAYYQFLLFLNGLGEKHDGQELSNLVLEPIDKVAKRCIELALNKAVEEITSSINKDKLNPVSGLEKMFNNLSDKDKLAFDIISRISDINSNRTVDITNTITEVDLSGKVKRENANAQRDVHRSHYGRLDMNDTPESEEVGLTISLCVHSDIDSYGFITTPLYEVVDGVVDTSKTVHLSYLDEKWKYIAPTGINLAEYGPDDLISNCTLNGETVSAVKKHIKYQRRQAEDFYGATLNAVPGVTMNGIKRYTLASSGFKQACPLLKPERSYLSTGFNKNDSGVVRTEDIVSEYFATLGKYDITIPPDLTITLRELKSENNTVETIFNLSTPIEGVGVVKYLTLGVSRSMTNTMRQYKLANSDKKHSYAIGEIVLHSNDIVADKRDISLVAASKVSDEEKQSVIDHDMALGQNLRVLFKTFEGFGYEDSIQLNKRFVDKFGLATVHTITVTADTNVKTDSFTHMEFTSISDTANRKFNNVTWLDENGLPAIGTYLKPGDVVIGRVLVNELDSKKSIPKPIRLTVNQEGYVWFAGKQQIKDANGVYDRVEVTLAKILPLDVGDKVTGGHGNKATCSRILEEHEMPYFADGTTPDIIFDPLGCIARENVGQITECLLAEIGRTQNKTMVINHGTPINPEELLTQAETCGVSQQTLYNPKTGEPYREKAFIGTMYMVRSTHTCFSKYMAMGTSKGKTSINLQPSRTGPEHAQRISELTTWCYRAAGAEEVLNSLFTLQSDDLEGHADLVDALSYGEEFNGDYESINGYRLQAYLRFFGLNLAYDGKGDTYLEPINSAKALELAGHNVVNTTGPKDRDALMNPEIFGDANPTPKYIKDNLQKYGLIKIPKEIISPIFLNSSEFTGCIPTLKVSIKGTDRKIVHTFEGLKPSEIVKIFKERGNDKDTKYFGTISEPTVVRVEGVEVELNKIFILLDSDALAADYNCYNVGRGGNHFFDILANESLYDLNGALEVYRTLYINTAGSNNLNTAEYASALRSISKSEDLIYAEEENEVAEASECSAAELSSMLSGYKVDHMRLEEMLQVTGYTLKSFMSQYVMVPPLILRPTTGDHGTYRAFSKVLSNILAKSTVDAMSVYMMLNIETKPAKKKNKKGAQRKTVITELTAHKNKASIIRDTILAKAVAYSGRSVISVDPTLKLGECKIPALMLVTIFMEHLLAMIPTKPNSLIYNRITCEGTMPYIKGRAKALLSGIVTGDLKSSVGKLKLIDEFPLASEVGVTVPVTVKQDYVKALKEELYSMLSDIAERYPVILSRDPALWFLSVRGHKFIPAEGYTIRIHPLVCMGFNADFDGDQMSAQFPMHLDARKVLGKTMMVGSTLINPQDGTSCFVFEQDILMGHFFATEKEPDISGILDGSLRNVSDIITLRGDGEFTDRYRYSEISHLYDKVDIGLRNYSDTVVVNYHDKMYVTTVGRLMFNLLYPISYVFLDTKDENGFYTLRFGEINKSTSKEFTKWILSTQQESPDYIPTEANPDDIFQNLYGLEGYVMQVADRLMAFGFAAADLSGTTLSYWDFANIRDSRIDNKIAEATKEAAMINTRRSLGLLDDSMVNKRIRDIWSETQKFSEKVLGNKLNSNPNLYNMIRSGARGSVANVNHICGFIGTVINNSGEELPEPIKGNYLCGLTNEEVSINAFDGRRIKLQTQGGSSVQGEKTRKLVYLLEHAKIGYGEEHNSCDTKSTELKLGYVLQEQSIPVGPDGAILYSEEPTADMDEREALLWNNFIRELNELKIPKCPGDYANKLMDDMSMIYASIEGIPNKVKLSWKLQQEHRNMLWYRTLDPDSLAVDISTRVLPLCIEDTTLGETNYILTHDAIDVIERNRVDTIGFYTMIGCNNHDGTICPRCFGYRYEDCKYPKDDEQIGYTVAGVIGQRGLQGAQNLHKSGGSGPKTVNIYSNNANCAFTSPSELNAKTTDIPVADIAKYYTGAIVQSTFPFPKQMLSVAESAPSTLAVYRNRLTEYMGFPSENPEISDTIQPTFDKEVEKFRNMLSTVSKNNGVVKIHNINDTLVVTVYDDSSDTLTWFPIWNSAIKLTVTDGVNIDKGTSLIELPSMHDLLSVNNTSTGEDLITTQQELAMRMWYTTLKTMTNGGSFAARNFELTTKVFNEVGVALENNIDAGIIAGRVYPTYKLKGSNIPYRSVIPSDFHLMPAREKVFASLAKGHFASKAASFCVRKTMDDANSSIGDAVVGIDRNRLSFPEMVPQVSLKHSDMSKIISQVVAGKTATALEATKPNVLSIEEKNDITIVEPIEERNDITIVEPIEEKKDITITQPAEEIPVVEPVVQEKEVASRTKNAFDDIDALLESDTGKYPAKKKQKKNKGVDSTKFFED